ncbi:MAG: hypothetical protein ACSLFD_08975 [Solirubrobacterales bacterium]
MVAVLMACGGEEGDRPQVPAADPGVTAELRESVRPAGQKVKWTVGPRTVFSKDGSASVRISAGPEGWQVLDDVFPVVRGFDDAGVGDSSLLTVASEPPGGRPVAGCRPPFIRRHMPAAGGVVQILENTSTPNPERTDRSSYPSRPAHFRVSDRRNELCGTVQEFTFRMENRAFMAWVWVGPDRDSVFPRRPDSDVRRQVSRVLNSFQAQLPGAAPLRPPFMALDCRRPPNTLGCDRVFIHISSRVPMSRVAVQIGGRGQIFDLRPNRRPDGAAPALPRTSWRGHMPDAGLTEPGSPLEVKLESGETSWVGIPRVRADVEVIARRPEGPAFVLNFPRTQLAAGHG